MSKSIKMKKLFFIPILFLFAFCQSEKEAYNEPLELLVAIQFTCFKANDLNAPEYFVKADSMLSELKAKHPDSDEYFKARYFIEQQKALSKN